MFCKNCGTEIADDLAFCPECGCKVEAAEEVTSSTSYSDPEPETDLFNFNNNATENIPASSKKKANGLLVGIGAVVVVLVVVVLLSKLLFRGGPADKILKAAENTVFAGADFENTVKDVYVDEDGDTEEYKNKSEGYWSVDIKKHVIEYQVSTSSDYADTVNGISIDGDKILSGYYIEYNDYDDEYSSGDKGKLKDVVGCKEDEFWGALKTIKKKGIDNINYEKFFEKYDIDIDDLDDVIDEKDIDNLVNDLIKAVNKNAKKNLGYKKSGKTLEFSFELEDAIDIFLPVLEKYIDEDIYDELEEGLEDELDDTDISIDLSITIEKNKITKVESTVESKYDDSKYTTSTTYEFEKIGKPSGKLDKEVKDAMKDAD